MPVIETINLSKEFKSFGGKTVVAVSNLSLCVNKGEIFAFLGPNGAGKSTTIKMLIGFIRPSSGRIKLFDEEFSPRNSFIKKNLGYLPEFPDLPEYYKVYELLGFYCDIFNISKSERKITIPQVLEDVGIIKQKKDLIKNLSMGQKRCLGLAVSLLNSPQLLLWDEPTVYLDPLIIESVRKLLLKLKNKGTTVFMSSHILSEVEKISDRFAIIKEGKLLEQGSTIELKKCVSLEEEFLKKVK